MLEALLSEDFIDLVCDYIAEIETVVAKIVGSGVIFSLNRHNDMCWNIVVVALCSATIKMPAYDGYPRLDHESSLSVRLKLAKSLKSSADRSVENSN
jgi:hypothetical protein